MKYTIERKEEKMPLSDISTGGRSDENRGSENAPALVTLLIEEEYLNKQAGGEQKRTATLAEPRDHGQGSKLAQVVSGLGCASPSTTFPETHKSFATLKTQLGFLTLSPSTNLRLPAA